jgi:hypothetical protein
MGELFDFETGLRIPQGALRSPVVPAPKYMPGELSSLFSEEVFSVLTWKNREYRESARDVFEVRSLLTDVYGFHGDESREFDPGEFVKGGKDSVIAVRAFSENPNDRRARWRFQCGFYICINGIWSFKRSVGGRTERDKAQSELFLKANPQKHPNG